MVFGRGGKGGGSSSPASSAALDKALEAPAVMFTANTPACKQAEATLKKAGAVYKKVELDQSETGKSMRAELKKRTRSASIPSFWIGGEYIGSMDSGGKFGGISGLQKNSMLEPLLQNAGAYKGNWIQTSSPLAPLFGNNLRNALSKNTKNLSN